MSDRSLTTHSLDCWSWGPKHYERLREEGRAALAKATGND